MENENAETNVEEVTEESNFDTLSELDKLAVGFIAGEIDTDIINSLDTYNRWFVLSMSAIYSCGKIGLLSAKSCVQVKYKLLSEYRRFRTETYFAEIEHREWIERTRETSCKLTELAHQINNKDTDALKTAVEIIDLFTKQDVYNQLFIKAEADEEYKQKCVQALTQNEKLFFDRFGNIPFVDLLFKFYKSTEENRAAEIYKELDCDNLNVVAHRVPVKSENCKGIAKSYLEYFK